MEEQVLHLQLWVVVWMGLGIIGAGFGFIFMFWRVIVKIASNEKVILSKIDSNKEIIIAEINHVKENGNKTESRVLELEKFRIAANEEFMTKKDCHGKMTLLDKVH